MLLLTVCYTDATGERRSSWPGKVATQAEVAPLVRPVVHDIQRHGGRGVVLFVDDDLTATGVMRVRWRDAA